MAIIFSKVSSSTKYFLSMFRPEASLIRGNEHNIKSKYDEERSLREAAEQQVTHLTEELNKEAAVIQDLKTELVT